MFKSLPQVEIYKFSLTGSIIFIFRHSVMCIVHSKEVGLLTSLNPHQVFFSSVSPSLRAIHTQHLLHGPDSNTHSMNLCYNYPSHSSTPLRLAAASTWRTRPWVSKKKNSRAPRFCSWQKLQHRQGSGKDPRSQFFFQILSRFQTKLVSELL